MIKMAIPVVFTRTSRERTRSRIVRDAIVLGTAAALWATHAMAQTHHWSQRFGGTSNDIGTAVAVDGSGNVLVTGYFLGTVNFGGGDLLSAGQHDIFVAKYNSAGVHQWSQRFGSTTEDIGYGVAVDGLGNVLVTGDFSGTVNFGGGNLVSAGGVDIFVAKYNSAGAHQWSQRFGSTATDIGNAVAVDGSGSVLVTGRFVGTVNLGGGNLVGASANIEDIFLAKYSPAGVHQWSQRFGGVYDDIGNGVAVDGSGNVVMTGYFYGTVNFGGGNLVSAGGSYDIFVAKYNSAGIHQWSQRFGGIRDDEGIGVAVDGSGNVMVTGYFGGTVNFGGGNLVSAGSIDIFVAKYNSAGAHQWSQRFGSGSGDIGHAVAWDGLGNVLVAGRFKGTVDFGGGNLVSAGEYDIYVAKYNAAGAHQWSRRFGSGSNDIGQAVTADGAGNVLVTGHFVGTVDFGGGDLISAGAADIFLAKFGNESPVPVLITSFDARNREGAVEVRWGLWSDEGLERFVLYRCHDARPQAVVVVEGPLGPATRSYVDVNVEPGKTYHYELVIHTQSGDEIHSLMATVTVPHFEANLNQNFPNPFNPSTVIEYTLDERTSAVVTIHDAVGRLVIRLDQGVREPGTHRVEWNGRDGTGSVAASGVYFYRLEGMAGVGSKKMLLLK